MARYVYRRGDDGTLKPQLVSARVPLKGTPREATLGFQETVLEAYKHVEAQGGYWPSDYSKTLTKRVHEQAAQRDNHNK